MLIALVTIMVLILAFLMFAGNMAYYGPFKGLAISRIVRRYRHRPKGEIVFYGASNFTLWRDMEEDL